MNGLIETLAKMRKWNSPECYAARAEQDRLVALFGAKAAEEREHGDDALEEQEAHHHYGRASAFEDVVQELSSQVSE